ncbi:MAG: DoxX family protein [Bacteroidetes bacterium]|nr:DoxX family protein [Bacteroidota bacterium]
MKNYLKYLDVITKGIAAFLMIQTLFFKFTASPESVYIFSTLGLEPLGRIGTGVGELIASILILIPRTTWLGALGAIGLMSGAIFFHFTKLGIEVMNDGGQLFIYACLVLLCAGYLLIRNRQAPMALFNKGK